MLTDPDDLVLDIFAGSNTTGQVAEAEGRRWLAFEERPDYVASSAFRFLDKGTDDEMVRNIFESMMKGQTVHIEQVKKQLALLS